MAVPLSPDLVALARWALVPRVLHDVVDPDPGVELLERPRPHPIVRRYHGGARAAPDGALTLVEAAAVTEPHPDRIPVLPSGKMGELMPEVRRLVALDVPALALDLTHLGDVAPFGSNPWRPRTREDLAELAAAAGRPVWLVGVASADDAAVAAEAGLDAIVVDAALGRHLGGPATADVLPEVVDAVAGMLRVLAGGHVGSGLDVFRLLALGADAVVVAGDRPTAALDEELRYALRLTGCATLADVGYDALFEPLFGEP
jgi:isopentenyl diphosphate isomerase/L-lactate dehydrogenase-like FMN-dependent dehydrogenase